jgi:membrane protein YqaA with SNARE-associated domain
MNFGPLRRLYHWTLGWADHPSAVWALFVLAFAESSFFPIPPDILLIALALGAPKRAYWFAGVCTVGSVLGGIAGYGIGMALEDFGRWMLRVVSNDETFALVQRKFDENTFVAVALAGFTPIPYKVFTIAAGIFRVDFATFVVASVMSRGARFYLEAVLLRVWGEKAKEILEKRFEWITIGGAVLLVGGFLAIKYLF